MKRHGLAVQRATVLALFLREIKTRFGKFRLGYGWALLEPLLHLAILLFVLDFVMERTLPDISFPVFLLSGIIPYFIFSHITGRSVNAIEANQGLFNYRPVKPVDTIIARTLLEAGIYIAVYLLLLAMLAMMGEIFTCSHLLTLFCVWGCLVIFSFGTGLIFMVISSAFPEAEKFLPLLTRPLYFISCVMYSLNTIPQEYQHWVAWNPLVHVVELTRETLATSYESDGASLTYLAISTLVVLFTGLALYRHQEEAMLTS
ncbi:ABC transporter permease [Cronobacter dublinensis]|uniref:ABC transporter permease n=1 Tax=Cronobacter dublinensis TaxID=413497 RepID=UPI0029D8D089|nr:ABC transporter permease [Cronobacter dublinensis]ELY3970469.1 ABC transporter permease [Cronobacter dublinensis]ELY4484802.1 ABC transporter permease [Cronobacter dublinensis]ELY5823696.1 ABC transporter permease [Cronobacter dublinensis]